MIRIKFEFFIVALYYATLNSKCSNITFQNLNSHIFLMIQSTGLPVFLLPTKIQNHKSLEGLVEVVEKHKNIYEGYLKADVVGKRKIISLRYSENICFAEQGIEPLDLANRLKLSY